MHVFSSRGFTRKRCKHSFFRWCENLLAEDDAASQAESLHLTKRYTAGNDLFLFFVFCSVIKKTSNTGTEKLWVRTHRMLHDVYSIHRLLEGSSMKSYAEEKMQIIKSNNSSFVRSFVHLQNRLPLLLRASKGGYTQQFYPISGPNPERGILGLLSAKRRHSRKRA